MKEFTVEPSLMSVTPGSFFCCPAIVSRSKTRSTFPNFQTVVGTENVRFVLFDLCRKYAGAMDYCILSGGGATPPPPSP